MQNCDNATCYGDKCLNIDSFVLRTREMLLILWRYFVTVFKNLKLTS